jgi:DNA (cytosine-5)-methyltransferase 1
MAAYYNELDPYAAEWLRNLIAAGHIAPGDVDTRSIEDVRPDDLRTYRQCHFFAGIGVWSHALRLAGWGDEVPVWSGSCPCQPFSVAGAGRGVRDERHLWPAWFWLIEQCRPAVVFGEQVEAAVKHGWLDLVCADLEGIGYAVGAVGLPAASVGAPHIRQRLWFVADAMPAGRPERRTGAGHGSVARGGSARELAHSSREGLEGRDKRAVGVERTTVERSGGAGALAHASGQGPPQQRRGRLEPTGSASHSFWCDADWIPCRDGKARPVEPGTFPLAHGATARVGRLRAYGNAIVPQVAAEVIRAYMDCRP